MLDHLVQNKHIAIFVPTLSPGGAEMVAVNLARGFSERGFRVDLLVVAGGKLRSLLPPAVNVYQIGRGRVLTAIPGLVRYLRSEHPWYLIPIMDHANIVAIWARMLARSSTKIAATIHCLPSQEAKNGKRLREKLSPYAMRWFLSRADRIITASACLADDAEFLTGLRPDRFSIIRNPVITNEFLRQMQTPQVDSWFSGAPVVLSVGRLTASKDFATLVRAFAKVREQLACRLMILGEGPERGAIEMLVSELGLTADVSLPGYVPNPASFMVQSAVFALASQREGFGNVLVEAMKCGLPVVSTDCDGPREILEGGKYGALVPVGDVKELADAMRKALGAPRPKPPAELLGRFETASVINAYVTVML